MHLPQIRPIRYHTIARRHVRHGLEHHQRKDLRLPLVLATLPALLQRLGPPLPLPESPLARQK